MCQGSALSDRAEASIAYAIRPTGPVRLAEAGRTGQPAGHEAADQGISAIAENYDLLRQP
jgi:hypothetical protein